MAVYGGDDPRLLDRAIRSVASNTLQPDDFILVVDGPVPPAIDDVIRHHAFERGTRVLRLSVNGGLSNALNSGLSWVRTEWVARADADDVNLSDRFEKQAASVSRAGSRVDLLGGSIVEVDHRDSPIALRSVPLSHDDIVRRLAKRNPFNHMTVAYRTALVREAGGYPDIHLKEDYALWANLIARGAICANLPDVLVRATTGRGMYARRGGLRYVRSEWALQRHLVKLGHKGLLSAILLGVARAAVFLLPSSVRRWVYERLLRTRPAKWSTQPDPTSTLPVAMSIKTSHPDVAAVIVLFNPSLEAIASLLSSLAASSVANVALVDNSAADHTADLDRFRPAFRDFRYVALGTNLGVAAAQNRGAAEFLDRVDYLLFLDQDSVPEPGMVSSLVEEAEELLRLGVDLAAIGPTPIHRDTGRPYRARVPHRTRTIPNRRSIEKTEIISSGSLVPVRAFQQVGGLDESLFIDGVDHEWCWRARAHHRKVIAMSPSARLVHMVGEGDRCLLGVRVKIPTPVRTYYQYRNFFYLLQRGYVPFYWKVSNAIKYLIKYPYFSLMNGNGPAFRKAMNRGIRDGVRSLWG